MTTQSVDMATITQDPNQPRKVVLESSVAHLAQSLRIEGLIHPIELDTKHRIIVGEMRYRAAKNLGWTHIDARINDTPLSPYERLRRQMSENLQQSGAKGGGEAMNPIDTAKAWAQLYKLKTGKDYQPGESSRIETYGVIKALALEVGVSYETVWEYIKILSQPAIVIEDILRGRGRTYYREAELAPDELKNKIKKKILRGDFVSRDQVQQVVSLSKTIPELALLNLERRYAKESAGVNKILSSIVALALGLVTLSLKDINLVERRMVKTQLEWLQEKIKDYLEN